MREPTLLAILLVCALQVACGGTPETPEGQVRAKLAEMEAAAETGDVGAFKALLSERYEDAIGNDKQQMTAFVTFQVLRHQRGREVIVRLRDVQLIDETRAAVTAHIGLAGGGATSALRGSVYALDLDFEHEDDGEWRVTWAQWQRAAPGELL